MKFLHLLRPIMSMLPEVVQPDRKVSFRDRIVWTVMVLGTFLWACQIPIYGVQKPSSSDPYYHLRAILASNRGTIMELGIAPIVTSAMAMQMLAGTRLIEVNQSIKEDRALLGGAQKMFGILICLVQAVFYVMSGVYGDMRELGAGNAILIIVQLFFAGVMVIMLDELLQKGYGLGSGISLFIATHVCETIVWKSFSPISINTGRGTEFEGAFIALFHLPFARSDLFGAFRDAFFRSHLPNVMSVVWTLVMLVAVVYLQLWRVDLSVKYQKYRGQQGTYPIKLFYTSNMPVILQTAAVANIYLLSQLAFTRQKSGALVKLLGRWQVVEETGLSVPVSGVAYYVSPPTSLAAALRDPFHSFFYLMFVLAACGIFSKIWIGVSGSSSKDVARQLRDHQMVMKGHRDSALVHVLDRYIPSAAILGGMVIGGLTFVADLGGAIASGTGILMAVTIIYQYYEIISREQAEAMGALGF